MSQRTEHRDPSTVLPEPAVETKRPDAGTAGDPGKPGNPGRDGLSRTLLRVPLFYKILIANALIVVLGAVVGTVIMTRFVTGPDREVSALGFAVLLAVVGVALTVLVNAMILRLALEPLALLEETAMEVRGGNLAARAPHSPLADRRTEHLTDTFNGMLDSLEGYRQRLRDVAARALNAEEEERKRIARELHDDTAQTLAALLIRLRIARSVQEGEARDRVLDELRGELAQALERVRRFARGLRPPALDELGLIPALESHARVVEESTGVPIRVDTEPLRTTLSPQAELVLYRIAQEALSNAVRHSGARQIEVRIRPEHDRVRLRVRDDGRGFDVNSMMAGDGGGLGLFGMQERAAYIGGRVEIRSRPGEGTDVIAEAPTASGAEPAA